MRIHISHVKYIFCRGDAARRPAARMAEHSGGDAAGVPQHCAGGSRGKSQTDRQKTLIYHTETGQTEKMLRKKGSIKRMVWTGHERNKIDGGIE